MRRWGKRAAIALLALVALLGAAKVVIAVHDADALYQFADACRAGCFVWRTPDGSLAWMPVRMEEPGAARPQSDSYPPLLRY